ncbi:MAG: hypothetical protein HUJ96_06930 [Marinilabiliaceae bacterium]|nr:hypothetical protein [Marinilabiliaceae bacterium]
MTFQSNNNYIIQDFQEETAIIGIEDDIAKMKDMLIINDSARAMMSVLDDGLPHTIEDIETKILEEFEIEDNSGLREDIQNFMSSMAEKSYITIMD